MTLTLAAIITEKAMIAGIITEKDTIVGIRKVTKVAVAIMVSKQP